LSVLKIYKFHVIMLVRELVWPLSHRRVEVVPWIGSFFFSSYLVMAGINGTRNILAAVIHCHTHSGITTQGRGRRRRGTIDRASTRHWTDVAVDALLQAATPKALGYISVSAPGTEEWSAFRKPHNREAWRPSEEFWPPAHHAVV
jgi:hypothetical protein